MATWLDIQPDTHLKINTREIFVDFFWKHAEEYQRLHVLNAEFDPMRLPHAHFFWTKDIERVAKEVGSQEGDLPKEPDIFKRCGFLSFWLRRTAPFIYAEAVRALHHTREERSWQELFSRFPNEMFAFDLPFRMAAMNYGAQRADLAIALAKLSYSYLHDVCHYLKTKPVSPHALYLIYKSLFEDVRAKSPDEE
jgi:hypothetical protein